MAAIQFELKRPNSKAKSAIICTLVDGRDYKIKLYPGISIKPRHWGKKNQKVHTDANAVAYNDCLINFKRDVLSIYYAAKEKRILPDKEYFKRALEPQPEIKTTFWELWDKYLKSRRGIFKPNSFSKLHALKNHLIGFEKEYKPLELDYITDDTMEDFQTYLSTHEDKKTGKQPLNTQSTEKYINTFKIFLNWCVNKKHTTNTDFKKFTPISQPDSLKVILTDSDIEKLAKIDLKEKNYLKNVRALLLLAVDTGLRYSDFSRIGKQHLKETNEGYLLEMRQTKTEDFVNIPLSDRALITVRALISGELHSVTNQKMNVYVKELCKLAGIDEPFEVHQYNGKNKTVTTVPKHELITTHTGRRTFATSLLNKGVPAQIVMLYTGHKDYKSFEKYVNIPQETQLNMVRKALEGKTVANQMWIAS